MNSPGATCSVTWSRTFEHGAVEVEGVAHAVNVEAAPAEAETTSGIAFLAAARLPFHQTLRQERSRSRTRNSRVIAPEQASASTISSDACMRRRAQPCAHCRKPMPAFTPSSSATIEHREG